MKSVKLFSSVCLLVLLCFVSAGVWGQVVISQYIETNSGSTPKGIEILNTSSSSIDFAINNLKINQGTNGGSCTNLSGATVTSGILEPGEVWVIGTTDLVNYANINGSSLSGSTTFGFTFNGDDAIEVYLGSVFQDMIGVCSVDPGSAWIANGVSTANQNITLKSGICSGSSSSGWSDPSIRFDNLANGIDMTDFGSFHSVSWISPSGNWSMASNWCPKLPDLNSNVFIPANTIVNMDASSATVANLTIDGTLVIGSNKQLTLTGALTNNGAFTLENGATFIQGTSLAGSGTYNVKQTVTGAGGSGSAPTGRFWYMGVPLNNLTRGAAFGSAGTDNRLWSWSESGQPQWSLQISDNSTVLSPTTGYVFRTSAPSTTLNFSGTSLYSIDASIPNLSNSGGSFAGCHLMANPYTAYLDWEQIFTASTNISSTYCIPTSNGSSMVYDTYNATGNVAVNPSNVAMTSFIAPMQAFWVVVNPTTTGSISMTKSMLSHQSGAVGLKDITSFPAFARLNLVSGDFYDQVVIYTDANATSEVEDYDSKKFFLPNKAQVYCPVGNDKLVINALKKGKAQTSAPLTVELPSTQVYKFEMAESFVENGLVILEDKQEGIFQDMGVNPIYEFYGNSGVVADRFVLHFHLPNGTNNGGQAGNEGQASVEDLTSGQIAVIANQDGAVTVALSSDLTTSGDIQIFDGAGRLVAQKAITSAQTSLQLSNGMGVYFVRVQTPMKSEMKKVMVY